MTVLNYIAYLLPASTDFQARYAVRRGDLGYQTQMSYIVAAAISLSTFAVGVH